jgi:hypothetical protein
MVVVNTAGNPKPAAADAAAATAPGGGDGNGAAQGGEGEDNQVPAADTKRTEDASGTVNVFLQEEKKAEERR